ncbi:MAG TPA: glycosyltransferase family 4 protein [Anaerolineae bacterium]|nr:glycosyltransferase family 4 protein [Anaerolineae bacterium]
MSTARIAFVDHAPFVGGAETVLLDLIGHLDRSRFDPIVFLPARSPLVRHLDARGVPWRNLPMPRINVRSPTALLRWRRASSELARLARDCGVDLVHSNTVRAHLASAFVRDVPVVWMLHDDTFPHWLFRRLRRRPARLIANSYTTASTYNLEGDPRACVVHNGVDTQAEPGTRYRFRRRIGIGSDKVLVAHVGRLVRWKGQHLFIRAAARVAGEHPQAHFALVGTYTEGDDSPGVPSALLRAGLSGGAAYHAELQRLAQSAGLGSRLTFAGHQDNIADVYAGIDLLVHASTRPEPFGRVLIEAMAAGLPVIASAQGGPTEIVEDGITGLLVTPGSSQALAEALTKLLADASRRAEMGVAARRLAIERFDIRTQVARIESIYLDILANRARVADAKRG